MLERVGSFGKFVANNFRTIRKYVYRISTLLSNIFAVCFEKLFVNYDSLEKGISFLRNIPSPDKMNFLV